jgi:hypothetical protein
MVRELRLKSTPLPKPQLCHLPAIDFKEIVLSASVLFAK